MKNKKIYDTKDRHYWERDGYDRLRMFIRFLRCFALAKSFPSVYELSTYTSRMADIKIVRDRCDG